MKVETKEAIIHVIVATAEWGKRPIEIQKAPAGRIFSCSGGNEGSYLGMPGSACPKGKEFQGSPFWHQAIRCQRPAAEKNVSFRTIYRCLYRHKLSPLLDELTPASANGERCCLWYTFPGFPLLSSLYPWDQVIYDCSDLWAAPISGRSNLLSEFRRKVIKTAELRIIQRADSITCSSDYLHKEVDKN